jgi:FkbM family methyltransferase
MKNDLFSLFNYLNYKLSDKKLSRIYGVRSLQNLLYNKLKPTGLQITEINGVKMIVDTSDICITPSLFAKNYEMNEAKLFKNIVKAGMTVVDIGAHIGYYTLLASRQVGVSGKVYAFEPNPTNFNLLLRNIKLNHINNVVAVNKAVSNTNDSRKLFIDKKKFSGSHSLAVNNLETDDKAESIIVETMTLDSYFDDTKIDLIKIDAQGAEGLILEGGYKTFKNTASILMEFWAYGIRNFGHKPEELLEKLHELGFKSYTINNRGSIDDKRDLSGITNMPRHKSINLFFTKALKS